MYGIKRPRLKKFDYRSDGYYFVTIDSNWREMIFKNREAAVEKELIKTVEGIGGVSVDTFIVMSNHIHVILVLQDCSIPLGEVVRKFKARVSRSFGIHAWQPNYYEHVIRDEASLNRIRQYIIHNRKSRPSPNR
ncbi:MAG: transposase [Candidatus Kerfeldbacteria bacterium]|nr:transposase [Candidatus Kerfeldbacteria bacterium]